MLCIRSGVLFFGLAAAILAISARPAAAVVIDTDTVIVDTIEDGPLEIRHGASPAPTAVTVLDPADINTDIDVFDDSILTIVGGQVQSFRAHATSQVTIAGGQLTTDFTATDAGQVAIVGGEMIDFFRARGASQSTITGGSIWGVQAFDAAFVRIVGGQFTDALPALENSLQVSGGGSIVIHGSGFNYPAGLIPDASGILTGTLASGEPISVRFSIIEGGSIQLAAVPEPATTVLAMLGIAGLSWAARRRRV